MAYRVSEKTYGFREFFYLMRCAHIFALSAVYYTGNPV
jgi:hypothetical protein